MSVELSNSNEPANNVLEQPNQISYWGGVFAMTMCAFALVASEFMPLSLLTPIAVDFSVTEGLAGQAISIAGAFALITSLLISSAVGSINRKTILLGMTALMAISGAIIGLAPNYKIYMVGRALIGISIGGFWTMSAATAIRLVPKEKVTKALAIVNGGNALATVVAAPIGSYLGEVVGWRVAFLCLIPIAVIAFVWQLFSLPNMQVEQTATKSKTAFYLFKQPAIAFGLFGASFFFMGQFTLFTYLRPFLETVTHVHGHQISYILLLIGIMGFLGTIVIGSFLNRGFYKTLVSLPLIMAAIAVMLILYGNSLCISIVLLAIWGLVATAAPVGWWTWVAHTMPEDAEAGGGMLVAIAQFAIGLGSFLGGIMYDFNGFESTFLLSVAMLMIAAFMTIKTALLTKRHQP
ncbi:MFS transporter [Methylophilus sp. Leaf414]|uniref:MFS transporter n=1 Tax=Methylophilus sp. Leaf414 TaxID=1736371 RepID=UPI0006F41ABF|nr:MFS transporter [Methylophilus sp. Leaf414]KQT36014.1 transcriptional regulator [Methylophilus sp. Leaf414]